MLVPPFSGKYRKQNSLYLNMFHPFDNNSNFRRDDQLKITFMHEITERYLTRVVQEKIESAIYIVFRYLSRTMT